MKFFYVYKHYYFKIVNKVHSMTSYTNIFYLNFLNLDPFSWIDDDWTEPMVPLPDIDGICVSVEIIWSNVCIDYNIIRYKIIVIIQKRMY